MADPSCVAPDAVTVQEQWAVHSDAGHIYRVEGDRREVAEGEPSALRAEGELSVAPARRYVLWTPDGQASTPWRWWL